jgi:VanZ family protein
MWAADLSNFAHGPVSAVLALIVVALLRRWPPCRRNPALEYALAFAGVLLLGAIIELIQSAIGRDAEAGDLLRDGLGALAALGVLMFFDQRLAGRSAGRWWLRVAGLVVSVAATLALLAPLLTAGLAYQERNRQFPVLADFDRPFTTYFVATLADVSAARAPVPRALAGSAGRATGLRVTVRGKRWWGVALREPRADWSGYERVMMSIANPSSQPLRLRVRILDARHSSGSPAPFSERIEIGPGSVQTAAIALRPTDGNRLPSALDLRNVTSLMIAKGGPNPATEFHVLRVWLE